MMGAIMDIAYENPMEPGYDSFTLDEFLGRCRRCGLRHPEHRCLRRLSATLPGNL